MPRKPQTEHARGAYIEEKFVEEAQRRRYDGRALFNKRKKDTRRQAVVNALCRRFAALRPEEKRHYQYVAEKRWPLWFERGNARIERKHTYPGPERVVDFELGHFTAQKKTDPSRNKFLTKHRRGFDTLKDHEQVQLQCYEKAVLQMRGHDNSSMLDEPIEPSNRAHGFGTLPPENKRRRHAAFEARRFLGSAPGQWTYHRHIYKRDHPTAGWLRVQVMLFRLHDDADRTMGTIVLKKERQKWESKSGPGQTRLSGEEVVVHEEVYAACHRHVVGFIAGSLRKDKAGAPGAVSTNSLVKRVSMEWVPHGHLCDFVKYYKVKERLVPEPFIWYCFKALTEVALVCWNGHAGRGLHPGWEHIVNSDLKLENIMLGAPDPEEPMVWARGYPQPKLADFGMAYKTHNGLDDRNHKDRERRRVNPPDFQGFGTRGYMPPELLYRDAQRLSRNYRFRAAEQTRARLDADLPHTPLPWPDPWPAGQPRDVSGVDAWTMVWQIGTIVWCLLACAPYPGGGVGPDEDSTDMTVDFAGDVPGGRPPGTPADEKATPVGRDVPPRMSEFGWPLRPAHSGRLVELAYRCMEFTPTERIGLEDLWHEVLEGCEEVGRSFEGSEHLAAPQGPPEIVYVPDKYPFAQMVLNDNPS